MSQINAEMLIEQEKAGGEIREEIRREARGEARGQLLGYRESLRILLEGRFGVLPAPVLRRIETTTDVYLLRACIRAVLRVSTLDDLPL